MEAVEGAAAPLEAAGAPAAVAGVIRPRDEDPVGPLYASAIARWEAWVALPELCGWISRAMVPVPGCDARTAKSHYALTGEIMCSVCNKMITPNQFVGNMKQHANGEKHRNLVHAKARAETAGGIAPYLIPAPKVLSAADKERRKECIRQLRALTSASLVARGVIPSQIAQVFRPGSDLDGALAMLRAISEPLGAPSTIASDLSSAYEVLDAHIAKVIDGKFITLVADGATYRKEKVIAVCAVSASLEDAVLLDLVWPSDDDAAYREEGDFQTPVYDFKRAAADIRKVMARLGIRDDYITGMMGDNAENVSALARELGMLRLKCLVHGGALTAKHGLKLLKDFDQLVCKASAMIYAGGSSARASELKAMGLMPGKLVVYPNRFASVVNPALYRLANFPVIKEWQIKEGADVDSSDDDDEDTAKGASIAARAAAVAYAKPTAPVTLDIAGVIFGGLPQLLVDLSGENESVPLNILERLMRYRSHLVECVEDAACVLHPALARHGVTISATLSNAMKANIKEVATAALASYDKHIFVVHPLLEYRLRYSAHRIPDALPSPESGIDLKQWIGCLDETYGPHIKNEYREFVACVSVLIASGQTPVNSAVFWESKAAVWPRLHKVALWHLNTPMSSLSAERAFAKLRDEDLPKRASALHATVTHELCFRYNKRILDELLKSALRELRAVS